VPALIVVVDNGGYTVERAIHGRDKAYNDIAPWRWTQLPAAFGSSEDAAVAVRATTTAQLVAALDAPRDRLTLIEAVTGPLDVPPLLTAVARAAAAANARR
jgi:indolepyruvate decarboxylase